MVAFSKIKEGMTLYDVKLEHNRFRSPSGWATWPVFVVSVDTETKTAMCKWNGNPARKYYEHSLKKLKLKKPEPRP